MRKLVLFILTAILLSGCSKSSDIKLTTGKKDEDSRNQTVDNVEIGDTKETSSDNESSELNIKDKLVVFEDPLFERYIRSYLDKSTEDKITSKELAGITELVIDRRFVEIDLTYNLSTLVRMDLTDLKHFPNLIKLDIQNNHGDILYSLDAIGDCSKLTELSLSYDYSTRRLSQNIFPDAHGYKTLYSILEKLPELKKLDLDLGIGIDLPDDIIEEVQKIVPDTTIVNGHRESQSYTYRDYSDVITTVKDLNSLTPDETVINMLLDENENIDEAIIKVASFKQLKILRMFSKDKNLEEINIAPIAGHLNLEEIMIGKHFIMKEKAVLKGDALDSLPNLKYLTLLQMDVNDSEISKLTKLKSLDLSFCNIDDVTFLTSCTNLYQLKLCFISSQSEDNDKAIATVKKGMLKQTKLQYLSTYMTGPIFYYNPEVISGMTQLRDFTSYEGNGVDVDSDYYSRLNFENNINLKRVVLSSPSPSSGTFDFSVFKGLSKLETLWLANYASIHNENILLGLDNLKFFNYERGRIKDLEKEIENINNISTVLIELPNISAVSYNLVASLFNEIEKYPDLDRISCKALLDQGIYEERYGRLAASLDLYKKHD